jgi:hypothetical protein
MRRAWLDRERGKVMKIVARGGEAMRVACMMVEVYIPSRWRKRRKCGEREERL